jgi:TetR/AcrR family transcriptional repressor of nem operon
MGRPSLREKIIESGVQTLHERGFAGAGVREITADAGVPQGCFTNHFRSKEAFAAAILDRYHTRTQAIMDKTLRDETRPAVERLRAYFDAITEWLEAAGWRYGCLVGNMSLEAPEHSELLRARLVEICGKLTHSFAEVVSAGQARGEIRSDLDADDTATFLLAAWEGAMMRMKVDRSPQPIEQFKRVLFAAILTLSDADAKLTKKPARIEGA